ncbi:hypothetical protein PHET_03164 [Paragonimus heterotremus]|uniref:HD/PDEase domain-containing protein n=1 Tax=Paragonimus heterotremus TaxID=100268 RepID=A0A8J4WI18_9TREM|nr:hypothetical protein PHET_03164 [Paragonimus heterotremus]
MRPPKIVQDAVHGMIELEPLIQLIVDTPEFQRLREIRQLGLAYLVFPSCQHTRFEHSIGTYHMAKRLTDAIQGDSNYSGPKLSNAEQMAVKVAALCHDLGHGPFSHSWETHVRRGGIKFRKYKHEKLSCRIFDRIVHNNSTLRDCLAEAGVDLELVKSLILGGSPKCSEPDFAQKPYIYEILSNNANGMDVDKWDYLLRDCLHAGLGHGCATIDLERFMHFCRPAPHPMRRKCAQSEVEEEEEAENCQSHGLSNHPSPITDSQWHLSFRDTELENVLRTFGLRQHLHQKLYQHKTVTSIAHMANDLLDLVEPVLKLRDISLRALESDEPEDLDAFLQLHDSLLWDIYYKRFFTLIPDQPIPEALEKAHKLVYRILSRQLYVYVDSVFEVHTDDSYQKSSVNADRIETNLRSVVTCTGIREPFLSETLPPDCRLVGRISLCQPENTASQILDEIFSRLPAESMIHDKAELLVAKSSFTSNSTPHAPQFYFYTRTGQTFVYEEPLRVVHAYRLYWRAPTCDPAASPSKLSTTVAELIKAFDSWHRENIGDRHVKSIS